MANIPSRPTPNSGNGKSTSAQGETASGSAFVVLIAWLWAGIPLAWGITQTVHKAMELFK